MRSKEFFATAAATAIVLPFMILFLIPFAIYHAWINSILWAWFIAPTFNLPVLSISQMFGVSLTIGVIRMKPYNKSMEGESTLKPIAYATIGPLLALGSGYVVKFWVM